MNSNWSYCMKTLNSGQNQQFFCPIHVTLKFDGWPCKNNRAPLLSCIKLCASFQSHGWIQTGVTVRKRSIWVKIGDFWFHVTLKFDGWPWKTIGHLFYVSSSFVHHFITICEFELKLQSGNAQFGSKSMINFLCDLKIWRMTLKTIVHLFYVASSLCIIS